MAINGTVGIPSRSRRALALIEKTTLGAIAGAAAALGMVEIVLLAGRIIRLATNQRNTVEGVPAVNASAPELVSAAPDIAAAQYETIALTVDGLPPTVRAYLIAATVLASLLTIGICAAVAWLCFRVFVGRPFVTSATWGVGIVAILVFLAGPVSSTLTSIAQAETLTFLGLGDEEGLIAFSWTVDLAPLGWALALTIVAAAFEIGQRMQRDTEGLV